MMMSEDSYRKKSGADIVNLITLSFFYELIRIILIVKKAHFGRAFVTHCSKVLRAPCFHFSKLCRFRSLATDPCVPILSRLL